jgi:hypothetical protein
VNCDNNQCMADDRGAVGGRSAKVGIVWPG